ncbi:hypothetical protein [Brevundimonas sp.]|jgi:hypothetical protein|uniref:hypothetical protein n=1 Tax=Brevundimonas sp. TaxID=1871086 RepID=UPI0037BF2438
MTNAQDSISFQRIGEGPVYDKAQIWLPQLVAEAMGAGQATIKGKTFIDCRLEGPAVLLPIGGCEFDACDMGFASGDIRNLLLSPVGPQKVTGAVVFEGCKFQRCTFYAVGFTGAPEFLKNFHAVLSQNGAKA